MSQGLGETLLPPMGTMVIDSVPPATAASPCPAMMRWAAIAMDCSPDEQKRLMVIAEDSTGKPARSDEIRATFIPCSASGMAQPRTTSSTSFGSRPPARAMASLITTAPRSSGRVVRSAPLDALPTAVRTALTITASRISHLAGNKSYKRLVRTQLLNAQYWMPGRMKKQQRGEYPRCDELSGVREAIRLL